MIEMVFSSSVLTATVILLRYLFRGRISRRLQYAMWLPVVLRLLIPFPLMPSPVSVINAVNLTSVEQAAARVWVPVRPISAYTPEEYSAEKSIPISEIGDSDLNVAAYERASIPLSSILTTIWTCGAIATGLWFVIVNALFYRRLRRHRTPYSTQGLAGWGLPVYKADCLLSPCLFGLLRPAIYLTPATTKTDTTTEHVITHEICHYSHGDHLWSFARGLCLALHWFNPLVWSAAAMSRTDCELACDERAVERLGEGSRISYGRTLLDIIAAKPRSTTLLCAGTTMALGNQGIKERIDLIIRNPKTLIVPLLVTVCAVTVAVGCTFTGPENMPEPPGSSLELGIKANPAPFSYNRGILDQIPVYAWSPYSTDPFQVDLRHYDLRKADLTGRLADLLHADFDIYTEWPEDLPEGFDPEKYIELGKNPGLGVRALHTKGVTGKGVGIAIIDQTLLVDHVEYKDQLRHYEQIGSGTEYGSASMHAPAVASIAVGKSVGVAPEADLYMICPNWKVVDGQVDFAELAKAVDRVVAINEQLPKDRKIRVLSMSIGWDKSSIGYSAMVKSVNNAKKQGIFVVSSSLRNTYRGFFFHGLGRNPLADPESPSSYGPGSWWASKYYQTGTIVSGMEALLIPMDSRATAAMTSSVDYAFYPEGGWSWCAPYIAGLYAMACQVKPDVTPESFWKAALATGDTVTLSTYGQTYNFGKIVNPTRLVEALASPD